MYNAIPEPSHVHKAIEIEKNPQEVNLNGKVKYSNNQTNQERTKRTKYRENK